MPGTKIDRLRAVPVDIPLAANAGLIGTDAPDIAACESLEVLPRQGPGLGVTRAALADWCMHLVGNGRLEHFHDPESHGAVRRLPLN